MKKYIEEAKQERAELEIEIKQQQFAKRKLESKLKSKQSGIGKLFAKPEQVVKLQEEVREANEYLTDLYSQYEESQANINVESDKEICEQYEKVKDTYMDLSKAHKIWDIVSEKATTETKSVAKSSIERKEVRFTFEDIDFILSEYSAFHLENADGDNLYIYPAFILQLNHSGAITLIDLHDLRFRFHRQRFLEEKSTAPSYTQIVDYTWAKVNKDGSRDRRFTGNYQIPIVEYGVFEFSTNSGLKEIYYVSNVQLAENFANEFRKYLSLIKSIQEEVFEPYPSDNISKRFINFDEMDSLIEDAARIVVISQQASASLIQRKLKIGYYRAGIIIDQLENIGIVGPFNGTNAREILVSDILTLETIFNRKNYNSNSLSENTLQFSYQYYSLLKDFSKSLMQIVHKLQTNDAILEQINRGQIQTEKKPEVTEKAKRQSLKNIMNPDKII